MLSYKLALIMKTSIRKHMLRKRAYQKSCNTAFNG